MEPENQMNVKRIPLSLPVSAFFMELLTLLLIGLKLTGHINLAWKFVLLPLYGPILATFFLSLLLNALISTVLWFATRKARK